MMSKSTKIKSSVSASHLALMAGIWAGSGGLSAFLLRQNNLKMLELRDKVFAADKSGQKVYDSLNTFQRYVTTHINSSPPKLDSQSAIQLKYTYDRTVAAEAARVATARQQMTSEATSYCETQYAAVRLTQRAQCVQDYVAARPITTATINKDLYSYNFSSPSWSPDRAGYSLVFFIGFTVFFAAYLIIYTKVRRFQKNHQ